MSKIGAFEKELIYISNIFQKEIIEKLNLEIIFGAKTEVLKIKHFKDNNLCLYMYSHSIEHVDSHYYPYLKSNVLILK